MDRETIMRTLVASAIIIAILWGTPQVVPHIQRFFSPEQPEPTEVEPSAPGVPSESEPALRAPERGAGEPPPPVPEVQAPPLVPEAPTRQVLAPPPPESPPESPPTVPPVGEPPAIRVVGAEEAARSVVIGSAAHKSPYDLEAEIDSRGAVVRRLTLARNQFFKTVADRRRPPDERAAMDLVEPDAPFPAFRITELRIWVVGGEGAAKADLSAVVWRVVRGETNGRRAVLEVDIATEDGVRLVTVRKTFGMRPRSSGAGAAAEAEEPPLYEMTIGVEFVGAAERVEKVAYVLEGPPALPREGIRSDFRSVVFGTWAEGRVKTGMVRGPKVAKKEKDGSALSLVGDEVAWAGQVDKYFAVVAVPQKPSPEGTFAAGAEAFHYKVSEGGKEMPMAGVRLLVKETPLEESKPVRHEYLVFAGPKDPDLLQRHYAGLGLPGLIEWTRCCVPIPGLAGISRFMVAVLDAFYALVRNYGLATIMLVVVLRVVLHPVTRWSQRSMAKMQRLGPRMQQIREEFSGDKQRVNEEMARLYKEEGFNPASGCLPMFVQMPIWIGLYGALMVAIQLRHAYFLPAWMVPDGSVFLQDLAQPDALILFARPFHLPGQDIPLLGWLIGAIEGMLGGRITSFNILPLLMIGTMYLQQRFTPQAAAGPQAEQQKRMMLFMMVFFLLFLYNAPSGLCLYIFTSSLLAFVEMRYLKQKFADEGGEGGKVPKPPPPPKKKTLGTGGRHKSPAERLETWLQKRIGASKDGQSRKK